MSDFCPGDDPFVVLGEARTSANPGAPSSFQACFWNALLQKTKKLYKTQFSCGTRPLKTVLLKDSTKAVEGKQFSENWLNSSNLFTLLCCRDGTRSDTGVWCWIESSVSRCFLPLTLRSHSYFLSAFIHFYFWKTTSEEHLCYVPWNMYTKFAVWGNFRIISVARNLLKACYLSKFSSLQKWTSQSRWGELNDLNFIVVRLDCEYCLSWKAFSLLLSFCIPISLFKGRMT